MVIWPTFRKGQHRANDHSYHAPQFISLIQFDPNFCMLVETTIDYYMDRNVWDTASITINFDIELDKLTPYS